MTALTSLTVIDCLIHNILFVNFKVKQQEDKITSLEVESKQAEAQLAVLQERPKTAMRPKTPQVYLA